MDLLCIMQLCLIITVSLVIDLHDDRLDASGSSNSGTVEAVYQSVQIKVR